MTNSSGQRASKVPPKAPRRPPGTALVALASLLVLICSDYYAGRVWLDHPVIALLAAGTGVQNATVRKLSVQDVTTTVLTLTLTGLAADSTPAGGSNPRAVRRLTAVGAMLVGAVIGAALMIHQGFTTTLWVTAGVLAAITLGFALLTDIDLHHRHRA